MWFECAMRVRKVRYYLSRFGHVLVAMFFCKCVFPPGGCSPSVGFTWTGNQVIVKHRFTLPLWAQRNCLQSYWFSLIYYTRSWMEGAWPLQRHTVRLNISWRSSATSCRPCKTSMPTHLSKELCNIAAAHTCRSIHEASQRRVRMNPVVRKSDDKRKAVL